MRVNKERAVRVEAVGRLVEKAMVVMSSLVGVEREAIVEEGGIAVGATLLC